MCLLRVRYILGVFFLFLLYVVCLVRVALCVVGVFVRNCKRCVCVLVYIRAFVGMWVYVRLCVCLCVRAAARSCLRAVTPCD